MPSTATSQIVYGLTNGTAYQFRVAAVNGIGQGAYSSASAAVTPATGPFEGISGMFGWWDSSDTTTLYSNTAGTTLATSGDVLRWNDKSVNGNHAIVPSGWNGYTKPQVTASAKNSLTALLFNAYGAGFSLGDKLPLVTTGATIFAALQRDTSGGNPTFIGKGEEGSYFGWGITSEYAFWRTYTYAQTSVSSSNAWAVMAITIPAGNWPATSIFLNGSAATQSLYNQGISAPPSTSANLTIGRNGSSGEGWRGYIGELVVFNGELTSTQRSSITTYLMTKWAIS